MMKGMGLEMARLSCICSDGPDVITRVLKSGRGRQKSPCQRDVVGERLTQSLLALKRGGARSQGMPAASRTWCRQGDRPLPRASKRKAAPLAH